MKWMLFLVVAGTFVSVEVAQAECCRLVKVDSEIPTSTVRACTVDDAGGCASEIFTGTLSFGDSHEVCSTSNLLVYQEWDDELGGFGPPISAVCDGGEVEL